MSKSNYALIIKEYDSWQDSRNDYISLFLQDVSPTIDIFVNNASFIEDGKSVPFSKYVSNDIRSSMSNMLEKFNPYTDVLNDWIKNEIMRITNNSLLKYKGRIKAERIVLDISKVYWEKIALTDDCICKMKELYPINKSNRDKYCLDLIKECKPTLRSVMCHLQSNIGRDAENARDEAILRIIERLWDYNPHKSIPSTYFQTQFYYAIKKATNNAIDGDQYTLETSNKLQNIAINKLGVTGLNDPSLDIISLAKISGFSETIVKAAVKQRSFRGYSLDDNDNEEDKPSREVADNNSVTPEEAAITSERYRAIHEKLLSYTEFERFIIINIVIDSMNDTDRIIPYKNIAKVINSNLNKWNLKKKMTAGSIARIYNKFLVDCQTDEKFLLKVSPPKKFLVKESTSNEFIDLPSAKSRDHIEEFIDFLCNNLSDLKPIE